MLSGDENHYDELFSQAEKEAKNLFIIEHFMTHDL